MNENCIIFEKYTQSRTICEQVAVSKDWAGALGALEGTVIFELGRLKSMVEEGVANRSDLNKVIVSLQQGLKIAKDLAPHTQHVYLKIQMIEQEKVLLNPLQATTEIRHFRKRNIRIAPISSRSI